MPINDTPNSFIIFFPLISALFDSSAPFLTELLASPRVDLVSHCFYFHHRPTHHCRRYHYELTKKTTDFVRHCSACFARFTTHALTLGIFWGAPGIKTLHGLFFEALIGAFHLTTFCCSPTPFSPHPRLIHHLEEESPPPGTRA